MPIKRPLLANNEIYHIVVRGVEGRNIFQEKSDYYRAVHNLFEFNDINPVSEDYRRSYHRTEVRPRQLKKRDLLVGILAFCLMPNHIHLLLRQLKDNGITKFMRKFGTGYAVYFNQKYERKGYLFQGRFRAVLIKTDNQLRSVFVYIHTNPAVLIDLNWKEGGIKNPDQIIQFIENYKWSSYSDYLGRANFPSVIESSFFNQMMAREDWQKFVNDWIRYKSFIGWDNTVELE